MEGFSIALVSSGDKIEFSLIFSRMMAKNDEKQNDDDMNAQDRNAKSSKASVYSRFKPYQTRAKTIVPHDPLMISDTDVECAVEKLQRQGFTALHVGNADLPLTPPPTTTPSISASENRNVAPSLTTNEPFRGAIHQNVDDTILAAPRPKYGATKRFLERESRSPTPIMSMALKTSQLHYPAHKTPITFDSHLRSLHDDDQTALQEIPQPNYHEMLSDAALKQSNGFSFARFQNDGKIYNVLNNRRMIIPVGTPPGMIPSETLWVNATKLWALSELRRGQRDNNLRKMRGRHVVKYGLKVLQGTWISLEHAADFIRGTPELVHLLQFFSDGGAVLKQECQRYPVTDASRIDWFNDPVPSKSTQIQATAISRPSSVGPVMARTHSLSVIYEEPPSPPVSRPASANVISLNQSWTQSRYQPTARHIPYQYAQPAPYPVYHHEQSPMMSTYYASLDEDTLFDPLLVPTSDLTDFELYLDEDMYELR